MAPAPSGLTFSIVLFTKFSPWIKLLEVSECGTIMSNMNTVKLFEVKKYRKYSPMSVKYLHLIPNGPLPDINCWRPFRAGVIIEAEVNPKWQEAVSEWLVRSGCLYMVAWGIGCCSWDDSR